MTREEAIEILQRELPDFKGKDKDIARIFPEVVIALDMAIKALERTNVPDTNVGDLISRQVAEEKLKRLVDEMALIFADIREKNVDDSVCGLCEYDCDHGIDGFANECPGFEMDDCFKLKEEYQKQWTDLSDIPSVEPTRKHGHWIMQNDRSKKLLGWSFCSECNAWVGEPTDYCSNCGADMREVDNAE